MVYQLKMFIRMMYIIGKCAILLALDPLIHSLRSLLMSVFFLKSPTYTCCCLYDCRFFDTNPSGRIMNRFSSDVAGIDQVHVTA